MTFDLLSKWVEANIGKKDIDKDAGRYVQFDLKGSDRSAVLDTKGGSIWILDEGLYMFFGGDYYPKGR